MVAMNFRSAPVLVAGAGGFVGGWLIRRLAEMGHRAIRAVDVKPLEDWYQRSPFAEELVLDLSDPQSCRTACNGVGQVFNLAADMGGIGYIESHKADCMLSVLINTNLLVAARDAGVSRYFFSSTACVYPTGLQSSAGPVALSEDLAYPADPEDGYGWEKLFSERMCRHFAEDFGIETRVARYHNIFGPLGTWDGGREKAPAAICRKMAEAVLSGEHRIEIWGDGLQTRSFLFVDDCLDATLALMLSDCREPLNIGSDHQVSINQLVDLVEEIAGCRLERRYLPAAATGVRGRNSDNSRITRALGWRPQVSLREGLEITYGWIYEQVAQARSGLTPALVTDLPPERTRLTG
jgi:nucleoside-diphosphate-sugar epimerase